MVRRVTRGRDFKPAGTAFHDFVDEPELHRFEGRQKLVALDCGGDDFERLAGVAHVDFIEPSPQGQDLARLNLDIGRLTLRPARGLMDHDPRVGQREKRLPLAPAHNSNEPIEAAWPMHTVETGERMGSRGIEVARFQKEIAKSHLH